MTSGTSAAASSVRNGWVAATARMSLGKVTRPSREGRTGPVVSLECGCFQVRTGR